MPAQRLSMRQVREVLRLKWACGLSDRKIAQSLRVSRPTVAEYVRRAQAAGLSWPLPDALDETALEQRLFATAANTTVARRPTPDWVTVHRELKRQGVTLVLLWQEYKAITPDGLQYSQFCEAYRQWTGKLDLVMRQNHRAGETLFVDYAGQTMPVVNALTGEVREAAIFIAVLGASNYTFAEATWSQSLPDWIGSHVRAFAALGGVPQVVVPDNLKAAVSRPHRYEPTLNRTYADLAQHYGVAIVPARAARPRDKAKVEVGVQVVERWILARLRHHTFFSLLELNSAIADLLVHLNRRPFKKLPGSRQSVFESLDRPALRPLPAQAGLPAFRPLLRGGFWDGFFLKYSESNHMHKRMLDVSERIAKVFTDQEVPEARELLWRAQGNDVYWHGLFGGLYLGNLRHETYRNLIAAEVRLDGAAAQGPAASGAPGAKEGPIVKGSPSVAARS